MTHRCMNCGKATPLHLLDAKPRAWRGNNIRSSQHENDDFDWLECESCYGPGWCEGVRE